MEKHLKQLPQEILDLIYLAQAVADAKGLRAYLVGGFVRDLILGVKNFDLDIAIEGDGIDFAGEFARRLQAKIVCHSRFGTSTVSVKPHLKIDVASTRKEFYPQPASLPVVNKGSLRDDLYRRDFTINTLVISLNAESFGKVLDLYGGIEDIKAKKIKILHELSFIDDPTRILRAVRFEQRYDFKIDQFTLKCLKEAVRLKMLFAVSAQRLRDELILILKEERPLKVLKRMDELIGLGFIDPGLKLSGGTERFLESCAAEISWFKAKFSGRRHLDGWLVYLAGLMEGMDSHGVKEVFRRFVFRKGEEKRVREFFELREKLLSRLSRPGLRPSSVFHLLEPLGYEVIVLLKASAKDKFARAHIENFFHEYHGTGISLKGHDLKNLGFAPGPHYQKVFRRVLNAKLNGKIRSAQEELDLAKRIKACHERRGSIRKENQNG